ncbi:MAG TPA: Flp family type IVb pilin [Bryobacteraceae bacterium]|jgi:Flp pilus assembly pilin Flp
MLLLKIWIHRIRVHTDGQDLIEYALMAAFLAVATAAVMPTLATGVSQLFSQAGSVLLTAQTTGS